MFKSGAFSRYPLSPTVRVFDIGIAEIYVETFTLNNVKFKPPAKAHWFYTNIAPFTTGDCDTFISRRGLPMLKS